MKATKRQFKKWVRAYWQWQRLAVQRGEGWMWKHAARGLFLQNRQEILENGRTIDGWLPT